MHLFIVALFLFLPVRIKELSTSDHNPTPNRRILAIGQDNDSIADYVNVFGYKNSVRGVSAYIDLYLNGLEIDEFNGSGNNNIQKLVQLYPNAALVVAIRAQNMLELINRGELDANIDRILKILMSYNRPVFLRFGYEFDGPWNAYDPVAFVAAWRRLANRLDALGGRNKIALVWHSGTQCHFGRVKTYKNYPFTAWYPGDEFVDGVAVSFFTPGAISDSELRGGTCSVANEAIDQVAAFAKSKKKFLMIAEATPQGYSIKDLTWKHRYGGNFSTTIGVTANEIQIWFDRFFDWIQKNDVRVIAYINTDWNSQKMYTEPMTTDYWGSSRVQDNLKIKEMWQNKLESDEFK